MSGHSKWANIKHQKDAADKKKGAAEDKGGAERRGRMGEMIGRRAVERVDAADVAAEEIVDVGAAL